MLKVTFGIEFFADAVKDNHRENGHHKLSRTAQTKPALQLHQLINKICHLKLVRLQRRVSADQFDHGRLKGPAVTLPAPISSIVINDSRAFPALVVNQAEKEIYEIPLIGLVKPRHQPHVQDHELSPFTDEDIAR